ncbi:Spore maturation protein A [bioreactor metagenome]|uniref:Spore maturation protein A n=1 Tax=bioreactor metagenome TaxID=1076179 RepID=A0A645GVM0_9ZZZZ
MGLGNAATPFGLKAMGELDKINPNPETASNHMVTFVVLNTASIQLLPTTMATLRLQYGAAAPMNVLPAVWITSFSAATVAVVLARVLGGRERIKQKNYPVSRRVRA